MNYPEQKLDPKWVHSPITKDVVEWCNSFGQYLSPQSTCYQQRKPMTTSQLRRFFGEVKRIEMQSAPNTSDIAMLNPLLAYAVGRDKDNNGHNKTRILEFFEEMSKAISAIRSDNLNEDYDNFIQIFEAIVAYHKYYGGKENSK